MHCDVRTHIVARYLASDICWNIFDVDYSTELTKLRQWFQQLPAFVDFGILLPSSKQTNGRDCGRITFKRSIDAVLRPSYFPSVCIANLCDENRAARIILEFFLMLERMIAEEVAFDGLNIRSDEISAGSDGLNTRSDGLNTGSDGLNAGSDGLSTGSDGLSTGHRVHRHR